MSGRRGNRESWVPDEPNARGYYEASVWMGTKPDGRPDRRHVERKSKASRNRAVRELERRRDAGTVGRAGKVKTVQEMLTRHLEVVLPQRGRAPRTINDYWSKCRNDIFPRWGAQRIDRLLPEHIEDGYAAMLAAGHAAGHIRKVHAILSSTYEIEVQRGNVARNPCKLVEAPQLGQADKAALSTAQARMVLAAVAGRPNAARWAVGLGCGLRQGEALGLRWSFVDLDAMRLHIWWQLQRLPWRHGCPDVTLCTAGRHREACPRNCPKAARKSGRPHVCTQAGTSRVCRPGCAGHASMCPQRQGGGLVFREIKERRRKTIPLPSPLVPLFAAQKERQDQDREAAANLWEDFDLVFAQPNGRPVDPRADWAEWGGILVASGLARAGTHVMRHSAATVGLDEGTALAVVQELLGHSDIRVTRGYTHVSSALAADGAERVGEALFGPGTATRTVTRRS